MKELLPTSQAATPSGTIRFLSSFFHLFIFSPPPRSTFELDTRNVTKPTLRLETVIDGKPAYQ